MNHLVKLTLSCVLLLLLVGPSRAQAPFDGERLVPLIAEYESVIGPGADGTPGQTIRAWHILRPDVRDGRHVWEQLSVARSGDELFSVDMDVWDHTNLDQVFRRVTQGESIYETQRDGNVAVRSRTGTEPVELSVSGRIVSNGLFNYVGLGTLPLATGWTGSYMTFTGPSSVHSHDLHVVGLTKVQGIPVWEVTATTDRPDGSRAVTRWFVQADSPRVVQRMEAETPDGRKIEVQLIQVHVMDR